MWTVDTPLICCQFAVSWSLRKACHIPPRSLPMVWVFSCPRLFGNAVLYLCALELLLSSWLPPAYVYAYAEYNTQLVQQLFPKFTAYEEESYFTLNCSFGGLFVVCSMVPLLLRFVVSDVRKSKIFRTSLVTSFALVMYRITVSLRIKLSVLTVL